MSTTEPSRFDFVSATAPDANRRKAGDNPLPSQDQDSLEVLRNKLLLNADDDVVDAAVAAALKSGQPPPPELPRRRRPGQSRAVRDLLDHFIELRAPRVPVGVVAQRVQTPVLSDPTFIEHASKYLVDAIYPYNKGEELVNDEMAYGETFIDVLLQSGSEDRLVQQSRGSRRTQSGRQVVRLDKDGTPVSSFPPRRSSETHAVNIPKAPPVPNLAPAETPPYPSTPTTSTTAGGTKKTARKTRKANGSRAAKRPKRS